VSVDLFLCGFVNSVCFVCTLYDLFVCHIKGGTQAGGVQEWDVEEGVEVSEGELTGDWRRLHGEKRHDFMLSWCSMLYF
jgi:hypothetical protein